MQICKQEIVICNMLEYNECKIKFRNSEEFARHYMTIKCNQDLEICDMLISFSKFVTLLHVIVFLVIQLVCVCPPVVRYLRLVIIS